MSYLYQAFAGTGVATSAFLLFSNVGAAHFGIMPLILNDAARQRAGLDVKSAVRAWDFFFTKATGPVVASVVIQTTCYLACSTYIDPSPKRNLFYAAALTGVIPLPFTLLFIAPSIKSLKGFSSRDAAAPLSESDQKLIWAKLHEWNNRHFIRMGLYTIHLIFGILAIVPDLPW